MATHHDGLSDSESGSEMEPFPHQQIITPPSRIQAKMNDETKMGSHTNSFLSSSKESHSGIAPSSAAKFAQERHASQYQLQLEADLDLDTASVEGSEVEQTCNYRWGHTCLVDRAWFPNDVMLAAFHDYVHPFIRSSKQKRVFVIVWFVVMAILSVALIVCAWALTILRACGTWDIKDQFDPMLTAHPDSSTTLVVFSDVLQSNITVAGFHFEIHLDTVRLLRVAVAVILCSSVVIGPLMCGVLYIHTFESLVRNYWMDVLGTAVTLLFITCSVTAFVILAVFIELVTDLIIPDSDVWENPYAETSNLSAEDITTVSVIETSVLFPIQLSGVFFSAFLFVGLMMAFAYINMGFLRTVFYGGIDIIVKAILMSTVLDLASGPVRTALTPAGTIVAIAMHLLLTVPIGAAYWLYQRKRLMQFMTTYTAALEHIRLKRPQIVKELCHVDYNSKIGAGGSGQVYRGTYSGHAVAVKEFFSSAMDSNFVDELNSEAEQWTRVNGHPHIVEFFGIFKQEKATLLVSELCDISLAKLVYPSSMGQSSAVSPAGTPLKLHELPPTLQETKTALVLQPAVALHIAAQTSNALSYLHALGVGHFDVKPGNILLKFNAAAGFSFLGGDEPPPADEVEALNHIDPTSFVVKLCDFGMAGLERMDPDCPITGSIRFMPPEQLALLGPSDAPIPIADEIVEEELEDYVENLIQTKHKRNTVHLHSHATRHNAHGSLTESKWSRPKSLNLNGLTRGQWSPDGTSEGSGAIPLEQILARRSSNEFLPGISPPKNVKIRHIADSTSPLSSSDISEDPYSPEVTTTDTSDQPMGKLTFADDLDSDVVDFLGLKQSARERAIAEGRARRAAAKHRRVKSMSQELPAQHALLGGILKPSPVPAGDAPLNAANHESSKSFSVLLRSASNLSRVSRGEDPSSPPQPTNATITDLASPGAGSKALAQSIVRSRSTPKHGRRQQSLSQEIPVEFLVGTGVVDSAEWHPGVSGDDEVPLHDNDDLASLPGLAGFESDTRATTPSSKATRSDSDDTSEESTGSAVADLARLPPVPIAGSMQIIRRTTSKPTTITRRRASSFDNRAPAKSSLFPDADQLPLSRKTCTPPPRNAVAKLRKSPIKGQPGFKPLGRLAAGGGTKKDIAIARRNTKDRLDTSPTKKAKRSWKERMVALRSAVLNHLREDDPNYLRSSKADLLSDNDGHSHGKTRRSSKSLLRADNSRHARKNSMSKKLPPQTLDDSQGGSAASSNPVSRRSSMAILQQQQQEQQQQRVEAWDVYSFGIVLWVLIRQRAPWQHATDREVMYRVCRGERLSLDTSDFRTHDWSPDAVVTAPQLLSAQTPRTSAGLRWLLLSQLARECWEQKPERRPRIIDVSKALAKSLEDYHAGMKKLGSAKESGFWSRGMHRSVHTPRGSPTNAKTPTRKFQVAPESP